MAEGLQASALVVSVTGMAKLLRKNINFNLSVAEGLQAVTLKSTGHNYLEIYVGTLKSTLEVQRGCRLRRWWCR